MTSQQKSSQIIPIMLGTAGHVDHGKTALVKHLTGVNTDRLEEEQRRGLSIDLAVAPCQLPGDRLAGIIDVPGHEDFIRNMVSGASSIDVLMLIVAADDAVMPQTIEHMKIVKLMGMSQVMVVITKIDLVDQEMLALVKEDVSEFMGRVGFTDVPMVCVSNITGEGIEQVRTVLAELVSRIEREPDKRAFRMYVRHVFSVKGYGTVVTGVPCSGSIKVGESAVLLPTGKSCSVRAIQTYRHQADSTQAHLSSAINLRDVNPEEVTRGMVIGDPGVYKGVRSALVWVKNESGVLKLKRRSTLRFHCGTAAVVAKTQLIDCERLPPGGEAFMQVKFEQPLVVTAGDRFILRVLSPADTLGGGFVLSVNAERVKRSSSFLVPRLRLALEAVQQDDVVKSEFCAGTDPIIKGEALITLAQSGRNRALELIKEKEGSKEVTSLGQGRWLVSDRAPEVVDIMKKILRRYHRDNKYAWGLKPGYATSLFDLEAKAFQAFSQVLTKDQEVVVRHGHLALRSFTPEISEREIKLRESVLEKVRASGTQSVARGNLKEELGMSEAEMKLIIRLLADEGEISVLGSNLMAREVVEDLRSKLLELFNKTTVVELGSFREKTGLSRNIAVLVLEHFDNQGMTRRQGNGRVLVQKTLK